MNKTLRFILQCIIAICMMYFVYGFCKTTYSAEQARNEGDVYDACCRVYNGGTAGSGCCFMDFNGDCYVLTNYHVAGTNNCKLQFFSNGEPVTVTGINVWHAYNQSQSLDAVILKVPAKEASVIKYYVPMWQGETDIITDEECVMYTAGCPRAKWERLVRGRIKKGNGNCVFKPTPYGGQSGSSIFITRDNTPFIGALLTWRTDEEGNETYGGLAQPIKRVLNAMAGNVANEECELPDNAIECPITAPEDSILINGVYAIECASTEKYKVEVWHMNGCIPCQTVINQWVPEFKKHAEVVLRDGLGADRFNATALGITQYPTMRVIAPNGTEVKRYVGASDSYRLAILATIKANNVTKSEPKASTGSGGFSLFDNLPKGTPEEQPQDQPDDQPKVQPKSAQPKDGGLIANPLNGIQNTIKQELDNAIILILETIEQQLKPLAKYAFLLMFFACLCALLSYKFVVAFLHGIFGIIKWFCKKLFNKAVEIKDKSLLAIADAVNKQKE